MDGEWRHKLPSQGKSNPKLGVAMKGVAGEAAGQPGGSNYSTDQLSSHTYNLEHHSEINSMEQIRKPPFRRVYLGYKHSCLFPVDVLCDGTSCFPLMHLPQKSC